MLFINFPIVIQNNRLSDDLCIVEDSSMSILCSKRGVSFCEQYNSLFEKMYGVLKDDYFCKEFIKTELIVVHGVTKKDFFYTNPLRSPISCILKVDSQKEIKIGKKDFFLSFKYFDDRKQSSKCDYLIYHK